MINICIHISAYMAISNKTIDKFVKLFWKEWWKWNNNKIESLTHERNQMKRDDVEPKWC